MVASLDLDAQISALFSDSQTEIDVTRRDRVFCNRNLRMDQIEMIGFDMDYTIAQYHQDKLEQLSIQLTLNKLCERHGYSQEIKSLVYDPQWAIRGLMVDRLLGNVFKMDRHSYVGRCYHGFAQLDDEKRKAIYRNERINLASDRYDWIDTLFGLPEAVMFTTLVDWYDRTRPGEVTYEKLFGDIRMAIDEAHRDDTLKSVIKAELGSFIVKDPALAETLHKFRSSGKKLFLLTNSLWDYTSAVMSFLLDGERKAYPSWRNYFDIVIVAGAKPAFFNERRAFVQIDSISGSPVGGALEGVEVKALTRDRIYQGGNVADFEEMTKIRGEHVLYIGDHIYGDILRLRKQHMWRTAMVLQELEREISVGDRLEGQVRDLDLLDRRRRNLESEVDYQTMRLKKIQRLLDDHATGMPPHTRARLDEARKQTKSTLDSLRDRTSLMGEEVVSLDDRIDRAFNPHWGSCLREGNENSRFGEQVNDYADLYTSRVSNFASYSPLRYFQAPRRPMPHEM